MSKSSPDPQPSRSVSARASSRKRLYALAISSPSYGPGSSAAVAAACAIDLIRRTTRRSDNQLPRFICHAHGLELGEHTVTRQHLPHMSDRVGFRRRMDAYGGVVLKRRTGRRFGNPRAARDDRDAVRFERRLRSLGRRAVEPHGIPHRATKFVIRFAHARQSRARFGRQAARRKEMPAEGRMSRV
jgi:hypothetical protein